MEKICLWEEMLNPENLEKVKAEFTKRCRFWNPSFQFTWDKFEHWTNTYYSGFLLEKYVYEHYPEVKPIDPDWEYLCVQEKPGQHTYDCYYNGISADIKKCYLNEINYESGYLFMSKQWNKTLTLQTHGAKLLISKIGNRVAYAYANNYTVVSIRNYEYYKFPIAGYLGE